MKESSVVVMTAKERKHVACQDGICVSTQPPVPLSHLPPGAFLLLRIPYYPQRAPTPRGLEPGLAVLAECLWVSAAIC